MNIFKRSKSKYWQVKFMVDGKRYCKSTRQTNKAKAVIVAKAIREAITSPDMVSIGSYNPFTMPMKLSEAIDRAYKERFHSQSDGIGTVTRLHHILEILGDIPLSQITSNAISQLKTALGMHRSNATVNRHLANLKTILNMACKQWEEIDRVPYIKMHKESPGRIRVFTKDEAKAIQVILNRSDSPLRRDVAKMVRVALDTGLRLGELVVITWDENIDLDQGWIRLFADQCKGGARTIPLTDRATETLHICLKQNRPGPFTHIRKEYVSRSFQWVQEQMGICRDKEFLFHACRHTCASRLINKGIEMVTVRDMLGHSSIAVTERYAHTTATKNLQAAIKMLQ